MDVRNLLGKRIRGLRHSREFTQADLAEEVGVSETFIAHLERGESSPSLKTLEALARALGVRLSSLFEFEGHAEEGVQKQRSQREQAIRKLIRNESVASIKALLKIQRMIRKQSSPRNR